MTPTAAFWDLALQSVQAPRLAARRLMAAHVSREVLATAFAAVVVLNALIYGLNLLLVPPPAGASIFFSTTVGYLVMEGVTLAGLMLAITLMGRMLGGAGRFSDVALLLIWLQALNIVVQVVALLLMFVMPMLSAVLILGCALLGFWIMLHFIDEAHGLNNLLKAFFAFVLGVFALGFALSIVLVGAGFTPEGLVGHV